MSMDNSAEGNLIVSNVSLEMPPYLGINMTDPIGEPVDSATAIVHADGGASCAWTLNSAITHFDPDPGNALEATIKEQGEPSDSYREEQVSVVVSQGSVETELSTNFTVVRIDIEMQDLSGGPYRLGLPHGRSNFTVADIADVGPNPRTATIGRGYKRLSAIG